MAQYYAQNYFPMSVPYTESQRFISQLSIGACHSFCAVFFPSVDTNQCPGVCGCCDWEFHGALGTMAWIYHRELSCCGPLQGLVASHAPTTVVPCCFQVPQQHMNQSQIVIHMVKPVLVTSVLVMYKIFLWLFSNKIGWLLCNSSYIKWESYEGRGDKGTGETGRAISLQSRSISSDGVRKELGWQHPGLH